MANVAVISPGSTFDVYDKQPQTQKTYSRFNLLHNAFVTAIGSTYTSLPVLVTKYERVRAYVQSTNNGTLHVLYTYDGSIWIANAVTGVQDPLTNKWNYEWTKDAPLLQVKYQYNEPTSIGSITGGVAVVEKVVI